MRRIIFLVITILSVCLGSGYPFAAQGDLATRNWSLNAADTLTDHRPSNDEVNAFMRGLNLKYIVWTSIEADIKNSVQFADLQHSGILSLIVVESNWRSSPIFVVDKLATGFRVSILNDGPAKLVKDDNDKLALVGDSRLTPYMGGQHCTGEWPVVWGWTGNSYSDVSSQSKTYYQNELARLKQQIAAAEGDTGETSAPQQTPVPTATPIPPQVPDQQGANSGFTITYSKVPALPQPLTTPNPLAGTLDCVKAEASRIERFLGISSDAGLSDAIKWAESDNPYDREFAADVLADINTPEAVADLKTLSHDSDRDVAGEARGMLDALPGPVRLPHHLRSLHEPYKVEDTEEVPMSWLNRPH